MNFGTGLGIGLFVGAAFTACDIWGGSSQFSTFVLLLMTGAIWLVVGAIIAKGESR